MMKAADNKANLIITKAQEMGLMCKITENNQWEIYLKEDYVFYQNETKWLLSVEGNIEIDLCNSDVLEFLEDLK